MDITELVAELTLDEKCALTTGADMWSTAAIDRLGIPPLIMTDGPNGARGAGLPFDDTSPATCIPCGSALGATWDPGLVQELGAVVGQDARTKAARLLLAPTVNLHRSPLGGRTFECYAEDPVLSGQLAAAFVRGVQAQGVAATPKHFVANDSEFERMTISAAVDERVLREVYLIPFESAVRDGGALAVMTAYNRLNGIYCSEHEWLIRQVLKDEWGFDGIVVTDWYAAGSTVGSARAGLDLEMPGPGRLFGPSLASAIRAGEVSEAVVAETAHRLLSVIDRLGAFADPTYPEPDVPIDRPEHRRLVRRAAADATVLLRNDGLLPLNPAALRSIAVIGPNADRAHIMGGGSASLTPHSRVTPLAALRDRLGDTLTIMHAPGCVIARSAPPLSAPHVTTRSGTPGIEVEVHAGGRWAGPIVHRAVVTSTRLLFAGVAPGVDPDTEFSLRARGTFTPATTGIHTFTLVQCGRARLIVDATTVLDGFIDPVPAGSSLLGMGSEEIRADLDLVEGEPVGLVIEYSSSDAPMLRGLQIGCHQPAPEDLQQQAVDVATRADVAVVVVGTDDEWEAEGTDRETLDLPGDQDELIEKIIAANPNTVVVVNAGAPVTMTWADRAAAVLQVWLGGQEMAHALVDVLVGDADPGGRLPITIPEALEHNPSYGNFPGDAGEVRYEEGLLVGHRWYEARGLPVRFPFGHGLSYTTFTLEAPTLSTDSITPGGVVTVTVAVTNTGDRAGSEVVQCYIHPCQARLRRPPKELKAFAKIRLDAGAAGTAVLELDARDFAYWDPGATGAGRTQPRPPGWYVDGGTYELHVGTSVQAITHVVDVSCAEGFQVRG